MNPCLIVMQPRRIPSALEAIATLNVDRVHLIGMWEAELVPVIADIVERRDEYTHFLLLADDTEPTQAALDLVLKYAARGHEVVTGYCNNSLGSPLVNLTKSNFRVRDRSVWEDYDFYERAEVEGYRHELVPSRFTGACLTCMPREMWRAYPFQVVTHEGEPRGYSSDWKLSVRLQEDGVPIVAPRGAFVHHLKERSNSQAITNPVNRLWVGETPKEVHWYVRNAGASYGTTAHGVRHQERAFLRGG